MNNCDKIALADGGAMPSLGLGLWKIDNSTTAQMVVAAIEAGYRHLDAACDYGNEREAGEGIRQALARGLCTRQELWVTSKLWNTFHARPHVRPAIERSLVDLGLDYLDLYLIHFPITLQYVDPGLRYPPGWFFDPHATPAKMQTTSVPIAETWGAMEDLHSAGLARHIGISNFGCSLIRDLLSYARIRPSVLQVESVSSARKTAPLLSAGTNRLHSLLSLGCWLICAPGDGSGERFRAQSAGDSGDCPASSKDSSPNRLAVGSPTWDSRHSQDQSPRAFARKHQPV